MKIGVLTLPLRFNYGGILQAFALQYVLKGMGHTPVLIQRRKHEDYPVKWKRIRRFFIEHFYWMAWRDFGLSEAIICKNTCRFIDEYITQKSPKLFSSKELECYFNKEDFDVLIVGSDQVWSKIYSPDILNYFLDFSVGNNQVKRIAYAASFGDNEWRFSNSITQQLKSLATKFDGISVREDTSVKLCKEHLNINVTYVLDPTMLLTAEVYYNIAKSKINRNSSFIATYILDADDCKKKLVRSACDKMGMDEFSLTLKCKPTLRNYSRRPEGCVWPSVEDWLKNISQASYVITDSFHGTVFSILFHRPFIVFSNHRRGQARIESLLSTFGLQGRLVQDTICDFSEIDLKDIDWGKVDVKLSEMRAISFDFLKKALS